MPELEEDTIIARPFWSGTITFGLVSIPVALYPAAVSSRVSLRMVSAEGTPLERRYFNPRTDRELDWEELVRGYEVEKDEYVVVTEDELERLEPERTREIDLRLFVPAEQLDPLYFERAYYLTPAEGAGKAYRLLAQTMEETGRAGIATFVMRAKEYLIAILAENGILRAETLRFPDEVRTPEDIGLPEPVKPKAAEVRRIEKQIEKLKRTTLPESELEDPEAERLLKLVKRKKKKGEDVVELPEEEAEEPAEGVISLMEALQRSLEAGSDGKPARKGARKSGSKKRTRKKSA